MTIERRDSQQTTCNATVVKDGERKQAASATCSIRAGSALNIAIDVVDMELTAEEAAQVAEMFGGYIADEIKKAAGLGIPVKLPEK